MYRTEQLSHNGVSTGRAKSSFKKGECVSRVAWENCTRLLHAATVPPVFHLVDCFPVAAVVRQVLHLLKLPLLQGATHDGLEVTVHPVGAPRTHRFPASADVRAGGI